MFSGYHLQVPRQVQADHSSCFFSSPSTLKHDSLITTQEGKPRERQVPALAISSARGPTECEAENLHWRLLHARLPPGKVS